METAVLRQVKIPLSLYKKIKHYCVINDLKLKQFYKDMLAWFIKHDNIKYQASFRNGRILSMWLPKEQFAAIVEKAAKANVSEARVVFTALILYCERLGLYQTGVE